MNRAFASQRFVFVGVAFSHCRQIALALFAILTCASFAHATNGIWTATSGAELWSTTTNWSGGIVANGADGIADFSTLNLAVNNTLHLDSARTIGSLIFGDTIPSNNWALDNNGNAANILTLSNSGGPTITVNNQTATISAILA